MPAGSQCATWEAPTAHSSMAIESRNRPRSTPTTSCNWPASCFESGVNRPTRAAERSEKATSNLAKALCQFDPLISHRAVVPHFQPIVRLRDRHTIGFEALGRSTLAGFEEPRLMFAVAEKLDQECALSEMLLSESVRIGVSLPGQPQSIREYASLRGRDCRG